MTERPEPTSAGAATRRTDAVAASEKGRSLPQAATRRTDAVAASEKGRSLPQAATRRTDAVAASEKGRSLPQAATRRTDAVAAWESLYRAQVSVLRHIRARFPEGVSFTEYDVLFTLSRAPGRALRIRDLNRHMLLTQPSVSRLIDRLVARGLVSKCSDPDDARGTIATLTDDGYALFRKVGTEHGRDIADRMLSSLDDDELAQLRRLSDKLRGASYPGNPADLDRLPPPPDVDVANGDKACDLDDLTGGSDASSTDSGSTTGAA